MNKNALPALLALVISLASWAGFQMTANSSSVTRLDERTSTVKEDITEIKQDVKDILRTMRRREN